MILIDIDDDYEINEDRYDWDKLFHDFEITYCDRGKGSCKTLPHIRFSWDWGNDESPIQRLEVEMIKHTEGFSSRYISLEGYSRLKAYSKRFDSLIFSPDDGI